MSNEKQAHTEEATEKWHVVGGLNRTGDGEPWIAIQTPTGALDVIAPPAMEDELEAKARLIAQAPSLKAENERLREANRVMLEALKTWQRNTGNGHPGNLYQDEGILKQLADAISIGEVRQGAKE